MLFRISSKLTSRRSTLARSESISALISTTASAMLSCRFSKSMWSEYFSRIFLLSSSSPRFSELNLSSSVPRIWILLA
jgi:acetylglutamate synthase